LKLSIIIPTIGRKEELFNTLKDLGNQNFEHNQWECLIIAQSEVDKTHLFKIAKDYRINLTLYFLEEKNASLARNIGLLESKGEIVLFLDDDLVIKSSCFLSNHLANFSNENLPGVFGQVLDPDELIRDNRHPMSFKKWAGWLYFPPNYNKPAMIANGGAGNLSVRKAWSIDVGGMDANFDKGAHREESDFCLRLTRKYGLLKFDPDCSIIHLGATTGGCRSWGMNAGIHPIHHIKGEWYFILNGLKHGTIKIYELHHHFFVLFNRQIWNPHNKRNIKYVIKAIIHSLNGFGKAFYLIIKKPRDLKSLGLTQVSYYKVHEFKIK